MWFEVVNKRRKALYKSSPFMLLLMPVHMRMWPKSFTHILWKIIKQYNVQHEEKKQLLSLTLSDLPSNSLFLCSLCLPLKLDSSSYHLCFWFLSILFLPLSVQSYSSNARPSLTPQPSKYRVEQWTPWLTSQIIPCVPLRLQWFLRSCKHLYSRVYACKYMSGQRV